MKGLSQRRTILLATNALILLFAGLFLSSGVAAASLSVGYTATQSLPAGTVVASDNQSSNTVVPADNVTNNNILGVVTVGSTVTISQSNTQVQVSTGGSAYVLVSDINGPIKKGDKITASPLSGIGMRATQAGKIVGTATSDLTGSSLNAQSKSISDASGKSKQVQIALIPLAININFYQPAPASTVLPKIITDLTTSINGKPVSTGRTVASLSVLVAALLVVVLIYGAVRSSIGAIGRNPLAKTAIQRSMSKVIGFAVIVLAVAGGAVYLVLKG
jgi:hypothetical protein